MCIQKPFGERWPFWDLAVPGKRSPKGGTAKHMNEKQKKALEARFSDGSPSSAMMVSTLSEWYDAKHRKPSPEEVAYANSIPVSSCPYCGSERIRRDGFAKKTGLLMRECRSCGRKFNPLAGTAFDSRKIPCSEWVEFLAHLFQFHSVKTASFDNRNAVSTGFYWLSKSFLVAGGVQEGIVFSGDVWIDETYFPRWKSKAETTKGGKRLRGLSRNQFCVCAATDGKRCTLAVCGAGKPSGSKAIRGYSSHIAEGSKIIHDGDNSHDALIGLLGLKSEVHPTSETKGLPDSKNPMEPVNAVHRYLAGFIGAHRGFDREELQGWLNLFCFWWNASGDAFQKAHEFIKLAAEKRVLMRYRDWKRAKKPDEK